MRAIELLVPFIPILIRRLPGGAGNNDYAALSIDLHSPHRNAGFRGSAPRALYVAFFK
jgi:hypothetical protein